jgi:putative photosynthetic complex assembly protein
MQVVSRAATPQAFPRLPLIGGIGLICLALMAAIVGRATGMGAEQPVSTPISQRSLRFEDGPAGSVLVYDAGVYPTDKGAKVLKVETGQNGFLRGTLRGFDRTRHAAGVGEDAPFQLTAWADGRLTLVDPSTGRHTDLEAFGPTNLAVFAHFLVPPARLAANASPQPGVLR